MDLKLSLGSRGPLAEYVDALNLLQDETAENGFNYWDRELRIQGTLSDPDTSVIMDLLKDAAGSALSEPEDKSTDAEAESAESSEDEEMDDAELIIRGINSLFGN